MIKDVKPLVWAFDAEWVPDPLAGHLVYGVPQEVESSEEVMRHMWEAGGATEEDPTPFLKTAMCRIVSVAAVQRKAKPDRTVTLSLTSLPHDPDDETQTHEAHIISAFLDALGSLRPQLVGFNSQNSDIKILIQRGLINGIEAAGFCRRPEKPWEGVDYFARASDWNVDLKEIVGGWGKTVPSLHEIAVQSGIPGKMEVDGNQVAQLWLDGEWRRIVEYNEYDALTTYLVWLRLAHFAGHFDDLQYADEQQRVERLLEDEIANGSRPHLSAYLEEWQRLRAAIENR